VDTAIEALDLSCRYGRTEAVRDVTFAVRPGSIFALLGPNGAGKTTTIRVLMNMLRPSGGRSRVLGVDSQRLGRPELERIGYVSENQKLPRWMSVAGLLAFCRPFYPTWDEGFAGKLVRDFELPPAAEVGHLSRGMRVKAALVSALAFRPRLLVLDEPFSGLDPVVRDDLVRGVLELAGEEHWTVLISSHDLDEVERLVDVVGFMNDGRLLLTEPLSELQGRFRAFEVTLRDTDSLLPAGAAGRRDLPRTWIGTAVSGRLVRITDTRYVPGDSERLFQQVFPDARLESRPMSLREIFVALARLERSRTGGAVPQ
jgi:ABC-2 type transport system ATP-binding protein